MATTDKIKNLFKQLFPTGRGFAVPKDGDKEKLVEATADELAQVFDDAISIFDSILPDNDNFTADDATRWEERLGLITGESISLDDRKEAIKAKMNHPGTILARQSADYMQDQIQDAGFPTVFVFENKFPDGYDFTTMYPSEFDVSGLVEFQHGDFDHGDQEHGDFWGDIIVNHIDFLKDQSFPIPASLKGTFIISAGTVGDFTLVEEARRDELRQLILKTKPAESIGFLFITYTT